MIHVKNVGWLIHENNLRQGFSPILESSKSIFMNLQPYVFNVNHVAKIRSGPSITVLEKKIHKKIPLKTCFQEAVRVAGLYGLRKLITLMETKGRQSVDRFYTLFFYAITKFSLAMSGSSGYFVAGLGYGSLATLFHMMNVLAASLGPGSPGLPDGSNQNLYFTRYKKQPTLKL